MFLPLEHKSRILSPSCAILYIPYKWTLVFARADWQVLRWIASTIHLREAEETQFALRMYLPTIFRYNEKTTLIFCYPCGIYQNSYDNDDNLGLNMITITSVKISHESGGISFFFNGRLLFLRFRKNTSRRRVKFENPSKYFKH